MTFYTRQTISFRELYNFLKLHKNDFEPLFVHSDEFNLKEESVKDRFKSMWFKGVEKPLIMRTLRLRAKEFETLVNQIELEKKWGGKK